MITLLSGPYGGKYLNHEKMPARTRIAIIPEVIGRHDGQQVEIYVMRSDGCAVHGDDLDQHGRFGVAERACTLLDAPS